MSLLCVRGGQRACCIIIFYVTDQTTFLPSRAVGFVMQTRKGKVAGATSGASSGPPTSPPLLCCCCCAAVVVLRSSCVSALHFQVVQFHLGVGSCASILPQNIQLYCCVVPPVVAHLKKTQALGWNFEVHSPNKSERQVPPPSPLLLMLLLQLYCFCCAMLLLL